jgi:hypothetical protein
VAETKLVSVQGLPAQAKAQVIWADASQVDAYARTVPVRAIPCRDRNRHNFPGVHITGLNFCRIDDDGWWIREVVCDDCGMKKQVQRWDVKHKRDVITGRPELVSTRTVTIRTAYDNDPGTGRIRVKMFRESLAMMALEKANETSIRALRQKVTAAQAAQLAADIA